MLGIIWGVGRERVLVLNAQVRQLYVAHNLDSCTALVTFDDTCWGVPGWEGCFISQSSASLNRCFGPSRLAFIRIVERINYFF